MNDLMHICLFSVADFQSRFLKVWLLGWKIRGHVVLLGITKFPSRRAVPTFIPTGNSPLPHSLTNRMFYCILNFFCSMIYERGYFSIVLICISSIRRELELFPLGLWRIFFLFFFFLRIVCSCLFDIFIGLL